MDEARERAKKIAMDEKIRRIQQQNNVRAKKQVMDEKSAIGNPFPGDKDELEFRITMGRDYVRVDFLKPQAFLEMTAEAAENLGMILIRAAGEARGLP